VVIVIIVILSTEIGLYIFVRSLGLPAYSRLKKEKILDHDLRQQILLHIGSNPGNHFKSIQKQFQIGGGNLAYHLSVLEREDFIKAKRDGLYKRFYPKQHGIMSSGPEIQTSSADTGDENDIQNRIITRINEYPGITQKDLALLVGISPGGINYHTKILHQAGVIIVEREGKITRCYLAEQQ
jgi:predicted transcriptional regulator